MTTRDQEIAKKIEALEEEDRQVTAVIEAAKERTHPHAHPTFADAEGDGEPTG